MNAAEVSVRAAPKQPVLAGTFTTVTGAASQTRVLGPVVRAAADDAHTGQLELWIVSRG